MDTLYIFGPELSFGDWSPNEFGETILNTRIHWRLYSRPSQRFMIARPQAARTAEAYSCTAPSPLSSGIKAPIVQAVERALCALRSNTTWAVTKAVTDTYVNTYTYIIYLHISVRSSYFQRCLGYHCLRAEQLADRFRQMVRGWGSIPPMDRGWGSIPQFFGVAVTLLCFFSCTCG